MESPSAEIPAICLFVYVILFSLVGIFKIYMASVIVTFFPH